ncbi:helicase-associated domain-containing protein [Georgenia sp. EYE_87]|uniref:helicase-associated domain-containing protein n=1 Tax=Georgenia sp. EYE_87 TaxID=2853448 RepID=UPI002006A6FD|nr:helicase-associated domain-containing protein [Georgenia sp. EYE_87]MCK6210917.1 helicase-associated domain-containing protein [Georgenia sp. EYE_87]
MRAQGTVTTAELATALERRDDDALSALLAARPDLASPAPSSLTSLAARAASRPSVERALATLHTVELAVAEAVVALAPLRHATAAALTRAVGLDAAPALARLEELALVVGGVPVATLGEALGPHPAGLGPMLAELDAGVAGPGSHATGHGPEHGAAHGPAPTTVTALRAALKHAPASALGTLDALTWGPPVGTVRADDVPEGAAWLLDHGLLRRISPTQLVLPREVALAARGGRTRREPPRPPAADGHRRVPAAVVPAEGARAAEEIVRLVGLLLETWQHEGAGVLRSGGVGVRELRRTAAALEVDEARAALVAELAAMAGLLAQDGDEQVSWVPARTAEDWLADPLPLRWVRLAGAWLGTARTPWLIGTRDNGTLRAALEPTLERGWAVDLRRRTMAALAGLPPGTAPDADAVRALLSWELPRATAPAPTVAAVLAEAEVLGITGAGALTDAGRALVEGAGEDAVAEALEAALPEPVGDLLVQGDLTAVVPGRPLPELRELLQLCADVESRGSALTVRFTAGSVRRAMDAGVGAAELLEALAGYSRTPLPQALDYLVRDAARRHGQVRVGAAASYLRVDDAALAAQLVGTPALAELSLRALAPTVLISPAPPGEVLEVLREANLAPVVEGPDGAVVLGRDGLGAAGLGSVEPGTRPGSPGRPVRTVGLPRRGRRTSGLPTFPGAAASTYTRRLDDADLRPLVARMRAGEAQVRRDAARRADGAPAATDPVHALALLREAAAGGEQVDIVVVGARGTPERRRVRPLSVDAGRVRVADVARETELTLAIHRISAVAALPDD